MKPFGKDRTRKNVEGPKKRSHALSVVLWIALAATLFLAVMTAFWCITKMGIGEILFDTYFWLSYGVTAGIIVAAYLFIYKADAERLVLDENRLEDTDWMGKKRLRKTDGFSVTNFRDLGKGEDGIVIGAEKKRRDIEVITSQDMHAVIVGTTGSGKSTGFVDQNIACLSHAKTKPSIIVTDPKRELTAKHSKSLEAEGYEIQVVDLRNPYASAKWNPMGALVRRIREIKELSSVTQGDGKYTAAGRTYMSLKDVKTRGRELEDEIFECAKDLVYTLCPIKDREQPGWESGARNLILGFIMAMCEDCIHGKIPEEKLILFNVFHNITKYCSEDMTEMKRYLLEGRDEYSKVRGLVNTVLVTSDRTLTSYLSEVNSYMQELTDDGILSMTSGDGIDIPSLDEKPSALFVVVPDERVTRHSFVTLFLSQTYKELVEKANANAAGNSGGACLKRHVYFILDEFGNLPAFDKMESIVSVSRSRGIRFLFVLQSFTQLNARYGADTAAVIKNNCNIKIFIGTDDGETRREFSELCGQKKIKSLSVSTGDRDPTSSTGAVNRPLISPGMLERLNGEEKGYAVVSVRGYEPIFSRFTPSYEVRDVYFPEGYGDTAPLSRAPFDRDMCLYDIGLSPLENFERDERLRKARDAVEEAENRESPCISPDYAEDRDIRLGGETGSETEGETGSETGEKTGGETGEKTGGKATTQDADMSCDTERVNGPEKPCNDYTPRDITETADMSEGADACGDETRGSEEGGPPPAAEDTGPYEKIWENTPVYPATKCERDMGSAGSTDLCRPLCVTEIDERIRMEDEAAEKERTEREKGEIRSMISTLLGRDMSAFREFENDDEAEREREGDLMERLDFTLRELKRRMGKMEAYLTPYDRDRAAGTSWENLADMLYALAENYETRAKNRILDFADYIRGDVYPKMQSLFAEGEREGIFLEDMIPGTAV